MIPYITAIENKNGDYDIVRVMEFKSAKVSAVDVDNERIYIKNADYYDKNREKFMVGKMVSFIRILMGK